jgi:hypothetical protein
VVKLVVMQVELEHIGSAIRNRAEVASLKDQVWLRRLGGSRSGNVRLVNALYTYSRIDNGVPIFRYRRSEEVARDR